MEVILNQDVDRLGKAGQVIKVKDGFARNFLIPNGLAVIMTSSNLKRLEEDRQKKARQENKAKKEAEGIREKLAGLSLTMPVLVQEEEKIYGSITAQDIVAALKEEGFGIDKSTVMLEEPIKGLGIYEVGIKLHPEITTHIKVWIVKK
ncbi:MAG TPA: 50S ribosomal protein L9 [Patescibacteria group bacterium]|nr:50S ribosomal protein L9 [Patescibacteria group bacterium]